MNYMKCKLQQVLADKHLQDKELTAGQTECFIGISATLLNVISPFHFLVTIIDSISGLWRLQNVDKS
jgi:hypothetical protein